MGDSSVDRRDQTGSHLIGGLQLLSKARFTLRYSTCADGFDQAFRSNTQLQQGAVSEYEDQSFRPESTVTRAEFAVMPARALKLAPVAEPLHLTDADAIPSWSQAQVTALVKAGIIHGRSDGSFDPQAGVTRAELAVMIAGSLHHLGRTATPGTAT